jgi:hypothetical protein
MRMRLVGTTYFKAPSRYWPEYTDENCRNVTLGGVSVAVVTNRIPRDYKFGGLPLYKFHVVNNNNCH